MCCLFVSVCDCFSCTAGVDRKISAIKHKNKAGQGHRVLSVVNERLEARKTKPANVIICCGLREGDHIDYFELDIPKTAVCDEFEYYCSGEWCLVRLVCLLTLSPRRLRVPHGENQRPALLGRRGPRR